MENNRQKIYFRADASPEIGYGHFIRSLALADMLKNDFDCVVFTQAPTDYQRNEAERVCELVSLPADSSKFNLFLDYLKGDEIVVLDNYFYSTDYQRKIKEKGSKLVCIDDMHDKHYVADAVVNHGFAKESDYSKEDYTQLYLGPCYAMLRSPFLQQSVENNRQQNKWVVCFGGSDQNNYTGRAIEYLRKRGDNPIIVAVVGDGYQYTKTLLEEGIEVKQRLSAEEMASLLKSAENVVCSASSVCYESLACGCKVYAGYYVENQRDFYRHLTQGKYIWPLGDLSQGEWDSLLEEKTLLRNGLVVSQVRNSFRALFYRFVIEQINYVDLTEEQSRKVWEVRNMPEIRRFMTNPESFSYESHQIFIKKLSVDPSRLFFAYFLNKELIGTINFVGIGNDSQTERGLFLNPVFRGHGLAQVLEIISEREVSKRGVRCLVAKVKNDNNSSLVFHIKAGYQIMSKDRDYSYFSRIIR